MSLSSALANAVSGLRANSQAARIVSDNISNALNENYTRRSVTLEQNAIRAAGGVRVTGINRATNGVANSDWRIANGQVASLDTQTSALSRITQVYGLPSESGSLQNLVTKFESELVSASSRPDLPQRLTSVAYAASDIATKLNEISDVIQAERITADSEIAISVGRINEILTSLQDLNARSGGTDPSSLAAAGLYDQRDSLLDELSGYMEIRVFPRDHGRVAVYSSGGIGLLDGTPAELSFSQTPVITANHSLGAGTLSALEIAGNTIDATRLSGGSLATQFDIRDSIAVDAQSELDAFAFEFSARVNDPAIDTTRTAIDPGFFTDNGAFIDVANLVGLSERISLNASVDPKESGDPALFRDGLLSLGGGDVGDSSVLLGLSETMQDPGSVGFGSYAGLQISLPNLAANLGSNFASGLNRSESHMTFAQSQKSASNDLRMVNRVDSDAELQQLIVIEQAYGANAQVIQVIDDLMDTLLGMV